LAASLLTFPLRRASRTERHKIGFDVATVVLGGSITLWYLVVGPGIATTGVSLGKIAAASVYPVTDLLLLFGVASVLLRATDPSTRRPLSLLAGAAGSFIVGDAFLGYLRSQSLSIEMINTWPLLIYMTAHFLLASAGLHQLRQAGQSRVAISAWRRVPVSSRLPYAAVGLGYCLMVIAAAEERDLFPWSGLVAGSVGITAMVVARQMVVQRESHRLAITDTLTGLANRPQLYDRLTRALERAEHAGQSTAVVFADMDGFKRVNDTLGHKAGDQMLMAFATLLRRGVFGSDLVARVGGDEFAIVLHDIGKVGNAETVVRRILSEMAQPVTVEDRPVLLRASFGFALCGPGEAAVDDLLHRADLAMYRAKRDRDTGWACYDPSMETAADELLEEDLRHAVAAGQLTVYYQPIVDLVDGQMRGVEALARWQHPVRGLLMPAQFIGMAERIGVIDDIGESVLEQACRQVLRWRRPDMPPLDLNINVSAHQLAVPTFSQTVLAIVEGTGFDPRHLVLEVTESAVVEEDDAIGQLSRVRDTGVRIALDDFGSGYSSLRYLTRLPVDILKLDRCFVAELDGTAAGSAVAQAVLRLGDALHLETVAEGVEEAAQVRELTLLGCRAAQGYHFAHPMPAEALTTLLDLTARTMPTPAGPNTPR
jgi:diguanylate cyclase (GGDEF)-like protein